MTRIVFIFQFLLSTVLCLAACAMWVKSYQNGLLADRYFGGLAQPGLRSDSGEILILRQAGRWSASEPARWATDSYHCGGFGDLRRGQGYAFGGGSKRFEWAGFGLWFDASGGARARFILLPWWAVVLAFLGMTLLAFPQANGFTAARRRGRGLCPGCGYDLRASPTRCPECGRDADAGKPPRNPWSIGAAVTPAFLAVGVTAGLCWWSNPARGAPPGQGANPKEGITFYPPWEDACGTARDRMARRNEDWGERWYQALWHRPDGDFLVIMEGPGGHLFWDYWDVTVLDRSMHIVRRGSVGLPSSTPPYRLAEIHIRAAGTPAALGDKWFLCVGWQESALPHDSADESENPSMPKPEFRLEDMNPVEWNGDTAVQDFRTKNGFQKFKQLSDQVRSAERRK